MIERQRLIGRKIQDSTLLGASGDDVLGLDGVDGGAHGFVEAREALAPAEHHEEARLGVGVRDVLQGRQRPLQLLRGQAALLRVISADTLALHQLAIAWDMRS